MGEHPSERNKKPKAAVESESRTNASDLSKSPPKSTFSITIKLRNIIYNQKGGIRQLGILGNIYEDQPNPLAIRLWAKVHHMHCTLIMIVKGLQFIMGILYITQIQQMGNWQVLSNRKFNTNSSGLINHFMLNILQPQSSIITSDTSQFSFNGHSMVCEICGMFCS